MIAAYRQLTERPSDPITRARLSKAQFTTRREAIQRARHGRRSTARFRGDGLYGSVDDRSSSD